jgi:catechol-2,3-dioxygenase
MLGMDLLERAAGRASPGVRGAAPLAHLVEKSRVAPVPRQGRFGLFHFALLLPDRVALGRFAAHGLGIEVDADPPRAFYHRALGFDKTVWRYPGALFLRGRLAAT